MALYTYTPTNWKNAPDHKTTPLNATNLNNMETGISNAYANIVAVQTLKVSASAVSSLPKTISNAAIDDEMEVVNAVLSNPSAQTGDWTVTTSAGSATISGSISGSTNITLYLAKVR